MASEVHESSSVQQTQEIAEGLAARLSQGGVVAISGELGAGKTQFVRGLVAGLGGEPRQVHSPTFVLLHEYTLPAGRRLFHLDAYRVSSDDFQAIGFDELLTAAREGDVIAIEWPQKVAELMPPDAVRVDIVTASPSGRRISIST